jgi:hypothetical protein
MSASSDSEYIPNSTDSSYSTDSSSDDNQINLKRKRKAICERDGSYQDEENSEFFIPDSDFSSDEEVHDGERRNRENVIPHLIPLSESDESRIYDEVKTAFASMKEHVCAVCDNLVLANECSRKHLSKMTPKFLDKMKKKLAFPSDLNALNRACYDVSSISKLLDGIMLSKEGIEVNGPNVILITFCKSCEKNIDNNSSKNPPKFAIANGLWIGRLPEEFDDTTKTEHTMMNLAQSNSFVMTVIGGYNRKMSSHAYSFLSKPTVPAAMLPRDILATGEIKVGIGGCLTAYQKMVLRKKFSVRVDRLRSLGQFYKNWNHLYENVEMNSLNDELENIDSHIVQELFENEMNNDRFTPYDQQNRHSEQMEDVVDEKSQQVRLSVITDNSTIGVWRSGELLSDYKKNYWTYSFCELFPFGKGGLEEKRKVTIGLHAYLMNCLRLSSRRFAMHESFPLVAFDVIARHNSMSAVFLRTQISPELAMQASKVTSAQFEAQLNYQEEFLNARKKGKPLPSQPEFCKSVFNLQCGIETGLKAYWGSNQERQ